MGYYQTEKIQDDGSIINYQHDKPLLEDSQYIWKKSGDTFIPPKRLYTLDGKDYYAVNSHTLVKV